MFHFNYTGQGHPLATSPKEKEEATAVEFGSAELVAEFIFSYLAISNILHSEKTYMYLEVTRFGVRIQTHKNNNAFFQFEQNRSKHTFLDKPVCSK